MKNYTDEQIKLICEGLANGDDAKTIAKTIGVNCTGYFKTYMSRIKHRGIWNDITKGYNFKETKKVKDIRRICRFIVKGYTNNEICDKFDKSNDVNFYRFVRRIRKGECHRDISIQYGIVDSLAPDTDKAKKKKERIHKICKCLEKGMTSKQIAEELGEECTNSFITTISSIRSRRIHKDISKDYRFRRLYKKHDVVKICECLEQGMTCKEISKKVRIAYSNSFSSYVSKVRAGVVRPQITQKYDFYKEHVEKHKIRA